MNNTRQENKNITNQQAGMKTYYLSHLSHGGVISLVGI